MKPAIKTVLRQLTPPVIVSLAQRLRPVERDSPLKAEYERLNRDSKDDEIVLRDRLRFSIHPDSRYAFEYFCYRAPEMVAELDSFLAQTAGKSKLLDVGALHGIFSLAFAVGAPDRQVLAVDASPIAFARLLYNLHRNRLQNVTPVECALSDASGDLLMHYEWEHAVAANTSGTRQRMLRVERRTGDDVCGSRAFVPDVLKIDVEGHEIKVLRGLSKTIEKHKPLIFLELHPTRILEEGDTLDDLINMLARQSYSAFTLAGQDFPAEELRRLSQDTRVLLRPLEAVASQGKGFHARMLHPS